MFAMSKRAKTFRIVHGGKPPAEAEAAEQLSGDRLFLLRELSCAAGELPLGAIAALTDAARDLVGPKCREALVGEIVALTRGMPTYELETLIAELRKFVCPPPATPARLSVAVQLSPEKPRGDGGRRKTRRRPRSRKETTGEL